VSEFAAPKYQKILSYTTGWLCAVGWQVFLASVAFMVGGIIQGLIALHVTLLTIGIMVFAIFFNTFLAVRLPFVEGCILILHLAGFFAVFIPMWVLSPRGKASDVLFNFENNGGWPTTCLSSMIGLTAPLTALIGYDCSVHMCKSQSSRNRKTQLTSYSRRASRRLHQ
jgi:choline transport protein